MSRSIAEEERKQDPTKILECKLGMREEEGEGGERRWKKGRRGRGERGTVIKQEGEGGKITDNSYCLKQGCSVAWESTQLTSLSSLSETPPTISYSLVEDS